MQSVPGIGSEMQRAEVMIYRESQHPSQRTLGAWTRAEVLKKYLSTEETSLLQAETKVDSVKCRIKQVPVH